MDSQTVVVVAVALVVAAEVLVVRKKGLKFSMLKKLF